jgi:hypothetical protein
MNVDPRDLKKWALTAFMVAVNDIRRDGLKPALIAPNIA